MTDFPYEQAQTFWTRKDETENKMEADDIYSWLDSFLSAHKVLALATGGDTYIRCTPLEASFGGLKSLQIEGTAEIVDLFSDEYKAAAAFRKIPLETLKKLTEPMWLLKITPTEITCLNSDWKKEGFGNRQILRK